MVRSRIAATTLTSPTVSNVAPLNTKPSTMDPGPVFVASAAEDTRSVVLHSHAPINSITLF